ncbi:MAG: M48 family metallopeptidase [Candidatus Bipolaricaulia bacterium]
MAEIERLKEYGFDPEAQEQARRYQLDRLRLKIVYYAILLALLLLFARFGSAGLADWIGGFAHGPWPLNVLYTLIFTVGLFLLGLPLDWWGYRIEQRYGLSTQSPRSWLADELKGGAINLIIFLIAFPAIYIGIVQSGTWWLIAWVITTMFIILMSFVAPVVLMPLFFKFEPLEDEEPAGRLKGLAERANVKIIGVFKMAAGVKTKKAVGALAGIGATRRIILSDTLLENYTPDEIETVIAHELGHHVHRDIWKRVAGFSAMTLIGFYTVHLALGPFARSLGLDRGIASLPLFLVILGGVFFILAPLRNTFSRWFEGEADRFALELARRPEAQARVDVKLCDQNLRYAAPHPVIEFLFYDHPAGIKRVERALKFRNGSDAIDP